MCGIAGKVNFAGSVTPEFVLRACEAMRHRGPSSQGLWSAPGGCIGMRRLAIIDLAGGDQPFFSEDGSIAVVMNGEIYNFQSLREQLRSNGHEFRSGCDAEVLVHLYEEHGEAMTEHLRGMFAFAVWDTRRSRLVLGRDRVGKKPLFWRREGNVVWFASELYALLQDPSIPREPNPSAIADYLAFQYVPDPGCAVAGVQKVRPATTLTIEANGSASERRYWELDYEAKLASITPREAQEELRRLLWDATRARLISEVPLGAFLSGGVDSSAVVAIMAHEMAEPVKTFSIGFGVQDYDELRYARKVAELYATDHHEFVVEPDAVSIMPKLARHYGEPFADPSAIPSFYLAELTSRHVTVALNGDGGDESFGGYARYGPSAARLGWLPTPLRRMLPHVAAALGSGFSAMDPRARAQRFVRQVAMSEMERYAYWMAAFNDSWQPWGLTHELRSVLPPTWTASQYLADAWRASQAEASLDRMMDVDIHTYLPGDLLVKMDIASMAFSVEARSPFLDHPLMEFAAALPARFKRHGHDGKLVLKSAMEGLVPDGILRRPKMGFGVPLAHWFRDELRHLPEEVLDDPSARIRRWVRPEVVRSMIGEHRDGRADHSLRLWVLLQLEYWHREVLESPVADMPEANMVGILGGFPAH
jgi:asparagine synthase (glutamine-hydrolysing)